jgi:hypothetical protein
MQKTSNQQLGKRKVIRNSNIELLRVILITLVIVSHCNLGGGLLRHVWFINISVPIFAIISGFFCVNSKNRFILVLINYGLNLILAIILYYLIKFTAHISIWGSFNETKFLSGIDGVWWYLYVYVCISLFAPLFNIALKMCNRYMSLICIVFLYFMIINPFHNQHDQHFNLLNEVPLLMMYYLIGAWLQLYFPKRLSKKIILSVCIALMVICIGLNFAGYFIVSDELHNKWISFEPNDSLIIVIMTTSTFIFASMIKIPYFRTINFLGKSTLYVYLYHIAVMRIVYAFILVNMWVQILIIIAISFIFASIISKPMDYLTRFLNDCVYKCWYSIINKNKTYA